MASSSIGNTFNINSYSQGKKRVRIEKAEDSYTQPQLDFLQKVWNGISYTWEVIKNTYFVLTDFGNLQRTGNLLRENLGHYKNLIYYNNAISSKLQITEPYTIQAVLKHKKIGSSEELFTGGVNVEVAKQISGENHVATCSAPVHTQHRTFLNPRFTNQKMKLFIPQFEAQSLKYVGRWSQEGRVNISQETHKFAFEAVSNILLGIEESQDQIQKALETLEKMPAQLMLPRVIRKAMALFGHKVEEKAKAASQVIDQAAVNVCKKNQEENLLSAMQNSNQFSDIEIKDTVKILFFAGQDTTASLLTYVFYQLGLHPEWREKIRSELNELSSQYNTFEECLMACKSLECVMREGLRLNPPAHAIGRTLQHDAVINNETDDQETFVPKGVTLNCNIYYSLREESRWGRNPDTFDPSRHEGHEEEARPDLWLAFSSGPTSCPGQHFALFEMKSLIATASQNLDWEPLTPRVKQTGKLTLALVADPETSFIERWTTRAPSKDIFIKFTPLKKSV